MSPDLPPSESEFSPATPGELSRFVAENAAGAGHALYPVGGRTALHYGYPATAPGTIISLTTLARAIDYPARDQTITVEAGIRMDELNALLRREGQYLPIDVAQSHRATLGGAAATNTGGSRRLGYGTFRDYVIGLEAVTADGRLFHSGGRVVKNVAGYDMCKLLVGSLGTLAIITQLTLKLKPLPEKSVQVWVAVDSFARLDALLERLLTSETRPVALDVLNPRAAAQIAAEARCDAPVKQPVLLVGFEGSRRETDWQIGALKRELSIENPKDVATIDGAGAQRLWTALAEYQCCADDPLTFQAHLLPSRIIEFAERATQLGVAVQVHAGSGLVTGHLPDDAATVEKADEILGPLRRLAREGKGNLVVLNCEHAWKGRLPLFGEPEPSWPLMQRVKAALDPRDLLNPGRGFVEGRASRAVPV